MKTWIEQKNRGQVNFDLVRPVFRAYALGYLSSTAPRLLGLLATIQRRDVTILETFRLCARALRIPTQTNQFPISCAVIVGGATLLPEALAAVLSYLRGSRSRGRESVERGHSHLTRLICTLLSSMLAFTLLNRDDVWMHKRAVSRVSTSIAEPLELSLKPSHIPIYSLPRLAGKTMDLTLFAFVRAMSVICLTFWTRAGKPPKHPSHTHLGITRSLVNLVDPAIFSVSTALIMRNWLYSPHQLPQAFNKWIQKAANIDSRILRTLRLAHTHEWRYGVDNDQVNYLLRNVARDLSLPEEWGDPAISIPVKCEVVHEGCGPSCEIYALWRFWRAWLLGMEMYLPLQLILRMLRQPSLDSLTRSVAGAARSSAFLGSFISIFYYGICLARSRIGPLFYSPHLPEKIASSNDDHDNTKSTSQTPLISPQSIDSSYCIDLACTLSGPSILLEPPTRRTEVTMFVAPRALATFLPRVYDRRHIWREALVFACSVTVVVDAVVSKGARGKRRARVGGEADVEIVRGLLGRVLTGVLG